MRRHSDSRSSSAIGWSARQTNSRRSPGRLLCDAGTREPDAPVASSTSCAMRWAVCQSPRASCHKAVSAPLSPAGGVESFSVSVSSSTVIVGALWRV